MGKVAAIKAPRRGLFFVW